MDILIPLIGAAIGTMLFIDRKNTLNKFFKMQSEAVRGGRPFPASFERYSRYIYLAVVLSFIALCLYAAVDSYLMYH